MSWFNNKKQIEIEIEYKNLLFLYIKKCEELETVYNNHHLFKSAGDYIPNENINIKELKNKYANFEMKHLLKFGK